MFPIHRKAPDMKPGMMFRYFGDWFTIVSIEVGTSESKITVEGREKPITVYNMTTFEIQIKGMLT